MDGSSNRRDAGAAGPDGTVAPDRTDEAADRLRRRVAAIRDEQLERVADRTARHRPNTFARVSSVPRVLRGRMSAIPDAVGVGTDAGVDTARGPPVASPLWHVLVGLTFLAAGVTTALVRSAGLAPGTWRLATVHLLLAGWVCCTILGAATQFVPVRSGVRLASSRLAVVQLPLAATGVAGLAAGFTPGGSPGRISR